MTSPGIRVPMPDTPLTNCRFLVDPPAAGVRNMAVDEYLLDWTSISGHCCWRFYQWSEATLSLGYFQQFDERKKHTASRHCPLVRRPSGGGAILHDIELTYSLTVPTNHSLGRRRQWTYETIHQTLVDALSDWGVKARLFGSRRDDEKKTGEFLCFDRRSVGDIVVEQVKIAGSAQRRMAAAVLQHGSVLLRRTTAAPELLGLLETTGEFIAPMELMKAWQQRLGEVLPFRWEEDCLLRSEEDQVEQIARTKYGNSLWTEKRRS